MKENRLAGPAEVEFTPEGWADDCGMEGKGVNAGFIEQAVGLILGGSQATTGIMLLRSFQWCWSWFWKSPELNEECLWREATGRKRALKALPARTNRNLCSIIRSVSWPGGAWVSRENLLSFHILPPLR